ncbi:site-2 protease family protein [Staphylococcus pseudintermedius]|uniref:site-2 protease family protein n=1 Tax=Staphylococcus pseudintermedius TaxID=283734 RepID=UPI003F9A16F0
MIKIISCESQLKLNDFVEIINKEEGVILYNTETEVVIKINPSSLFIIDIIKNEPKKMADIFIFFKITSTMQKRRIKDFYFQLFKKGMIEINNEQFKYVHSNKYRTYKISKEFFFKNKSVSVNVKSDYLLINSYYKFIMSIMLIIVTLGISLFTLYNNRYILQHKTDINIHFIFLFIIIQIIIHETAHAYFVLKYGARIKSVGIGLLYYFIPHAFVKYSQAFRLNNFQKATISYAGPLVDSIFIYLSIVLISTSNLIDKLDVYVLLFYQSTILLFNCNLLMPSDLFKMIENFLKLKNLRINSKKTFINNFKKDKEDIEISKNIFYTSYFILCILYVVIIFILFLINFLFLVKGMTKWLISI